MKLLILTQKVDSSDAVLGFFHSWIAEFASRCEKVTVVCLEKGIHDLPSNVTVLSLGKEAGASRPRRVSNFYTHIVGRLAEYDAVFVHMNPEYAILGGWLWRLAGKKVSLWYVHRSVDLKLRLAVLFCHVVFSSTKEGFRLDTPKARYIGHGIDTSAFSYSPKERGRPFTIVSVGRITRIKNLETLIRAAAQLKDVHRAPFVVRLVGAPVRSDDVRYKEELEELIAKHGLAGEVSFDGEVPNADMPAVYHRADLSVNLAPTGGMDKAVLESLATGTPALVSNEAFAVILGGRAKDLMFGHGDFEALARKIADMSKRDLSGMAAELSRTVAAECSIEGIVRKIIETLS